MNRVKSTSATSTPWVLALLILTLGAWLGHPAVAQEGAEPTVDRPRVALETNQGTIVLELYSDKAPKTVANFLEYVESGFYDGTIFHRVIPEFMIQGGGFTQELEQKQTRPPVENEANNGMKNQRGTVAMARTGNPHSATAQFFVNVVDNDYLNHTAETMQGWGYTVFGHVVEGMDVVDAISRMPTTRSGRLPNLPAETVVIESARTAAEGIDGETAEGNSAGR